MALNQYRWIAVALFLSAPSCGSSDEPPPTTTPAIEAGSDVAQGADVAQGGKDGSPDTSSALDANMLPDVSDAGGQPLPDVIPDDARTGLERDLPYVPRAYPPENPFTAQKATLGKILFWEEQISTKDNQACGTCHRPAAGGSDPRSAEALSLGPGPDGIFGNADDVHGGRGIRKCDSLGNFVTDPVFGDKPQVTPRKPPTYLDAMYFDTLFWDGRANKVFIDPVTKMVAIADNAALETQASKPPESTAEMACDGWTWTSIATKLVTAKPLKFAKTIPKDMSDAIAAHATYPDLFTWVYGTSEITASKIIFAIATHERTLLSKKTPWDRFNAGDTTALTQNQVHGLVLFNTKAKCRACHEPPLFTDKAFHNIGFSDPVLDPGKKAISMDNTELGQMKTPTLRNVGLRQAAGLLHNGTNNGASLQAVLTAYNQGGTNKNNIDSKIEQLNLSQDEFNDLLDFLQNGLTDPDVQDEIFPFDRPKLGTE
jgi:cytochrome c peroxidase